MTIPFLDLKSPYQELKEELEATFRHVLESGRYVLGEELDSFESEFAAYCGARCCVGVGNGLDALHLILRGYDIGEGDEVIVPSNTYIATWLAVSQSGAKPIPVEPDPFTYNIDPAHVEAAISPRTRAIIAVHLYGLPADMTRLSSIAKRGQIKLIEDAAQAHGAAAQGRLTGSLGDAAGFSFYPSKNLGGFGDGGAVVTDDASLAERIRLLRNYGSNIKYRNEKRGYNSRLDPIQAALLKVKLKHLDAWNERRTRIAQLYLKELAQAPGIQLPLSPPTLKPAWHLFVVRHPERDTLQAHLQQRGIETLIHYPIPPHLSPAYKDLTLRGVDFPVTEALAETVLSLPMGPHLSLDDARTIVESVREFQSARLAHKI